jgi:hypothetical protein
MVAEMDIIHVCLAGKFALDRQLVGGQSHCFFRNVFGYAVHFEHDAPGLNNGHPSFDGALTFTHSRFERLFGYRLIREDSNPNFSASFDVAGHGDTSGFNLPTGDPFGFHGHQTEIAESDGIASGGFTGAAATVLFSKLRSLRQ